ncbi:MAG: amidohydrolase family protein [Gemmatimonadaceae bacterium]|nr:amidohydrolase family protein [Gemmatimonadaceae bacterium]
MRTTALTTVALVIAAAPLAAQARPAAPQPILIRNATVLTITKGTLPSTDILLEGGRIARIGSGLTAPAGARVIDATGKYVMPGIIDAHSHMMSDAINEGSLSVTSMTRIEDVLNPTAVNVYRALAGGVTAANLLHGSANTIGGQSATVKLKYGTSASEMLFAGAPPGIKFALGENVTRKNRLALPGSVARYPTTRMGQEEVLRDAFTRAREYQQDWADHRTRARTDRNAVAPRRDLELEPLVEILEGKRLVHAHSYRADEIHMLLILADEFGFKVKTLQHVLEGYKVAPEIAKHGAGASTFADNWSYKIEAYDAIPHAAAIMTRAGVITTINSDSDERIRRLNTDAAKMMRYGDLTEEEALKLITWNAAWQLGVEDRVGSIEVGKDADLAIWNAHPLSVYASAETTIIDGQVYFDKQLDREMRERREAERQSLLASSRPAPAALPNEDNQ